MEREKVSSQTSRSGECGHPQFDLEQGTHHMTLYSQQHDNNMHIHDVYTCRNTFTLYTCTCNKQYIIIYCITIHTVVVTAVGMCCVVTAVGMCCMVTAVGMCCVVTVYSLSGGSHDANSGSSSSAASFFYTHMKYMKIHFHDDCTQGPYNNYYTCF